jgi:uncharacterized protein YdgA (DUF945 family)
VKRWIVLLLLLLAIIVIVAPGVVGRLAEKNIADNVAWADAEAPGVSVTTERFERGWFTSEGRHRVVFEDGTLHEAVDVYLPGSGAAMPALIITTRIDHGLVPLSSLARDAGTIVPGLASTVSTFQFDPGNGQLLEVPGTLYSKVALSGSSKSRFLLESGSLEHRDLRAEWQGADLVFVTDPSTGAFGVSGRTEPFSIAESSESVRFGAMTVSLEQVRSKYGFKTGSVAVELGGLDAQSAVSPFAIASLSLKAGNEIRGDRMHAHSVFSLADAAIPSIGSLDLATDLSIEGLDAASLGVITEAIQQAQDADDPELALQLLYPDIEDEVQDLLAAGGRIRFEQLDVTLPQGTLETRIDIEFAELAADIAFSWPAVLLAMTADIDVRIPAGLYEFATMMNPEVETLVAMGVLKRDGEYYLLAAQYAQGLLNVNGAPMPVPMPGVQ